MLRAILAAWILTAAALAEQTVEGRVVNSATGAGIPGVTVNLTGGADAAYSAATDSEGRFRIERVKDGAYVAFYFLYRYWPVPNPSDGQPEPFRVITGGEPVRLETKLHPIPELSVRVLDGEGKRVPNAILWLVSGSSRCNSPSCANSYMHYQTDEKGEYKIANLDFPGTWRLSATAPSTWKPPESSDDQRLGWAQTFYPGVTDLQLAEKLLLRPEGNGWSLDVKLAAVPVHRIRGRVLDAHGDPAPKVSVTLGRAFGPNLHEDTKADGTFEFGSVADDEWRLSAMVEKDGAKLRANQAVKINGHDLETAELRLTAPFSVHGKVVMEVTEGTPAPKPPEVVVVPRALLLSDSYGDRFLAGEPDGKGDFAIENLYPGAYEINFFEPPPAPYYLDSIRLGERDALESDVQILSDVQPLTITYKSKGGTVRGTIEACGAGRVLLIPRDPALRGHFRRVTTCAPNGQFEILAVRPGEYYIFAISVAGPTPWHEAVFEAAQDDSLLNQASSVTVRPNESISADLRVLKR